MKFREWLPIRGRNRFALGLAGLSLAILLSWNYLPYYEGEGEPSKERVVAVVWPETFSPDTYLSILKSPDVEGFLNLAAYIALILSTLVILLAVPFWEILHGSAYIRVPLALVNLTGGSVVLWLLLDLGIDDPTPMALETLCLIALGMFTISAALFLFKNELALREARSRSTGR